MKRLLHILIPLLLLALQSSSCDKQDPEPQETTLPPLTHEGKNTFGCKINGEVWVAEVEPSVWVSEVSSFYYADDSGYFGVEGVKEYSDQSLEIISLFANIENEGNYQIKTYTEGGPTGYTISSGIKCDYSHAHYLPGNLNVTHFDTLDKIISGTFDMDLVNPNCSQDTVMHITEGRFDVHY